MDRKRNDSIFVLSPNPVLASDLEQAPNYKYLETIRYAVQPLQLGHNQINRTPIYPFAAQIPLFNSIMQSD